MKKFILLVVLFVQNVAEANIQRKSDKFLPIPTAKQQKEKAIEISKNCEIVIDGKKGTLRDLKEGMDVTYYIENGVIVKIEATSSK